MASPTSTARVLQFSIASTGRAATRLVPTTATPMLRRPTLAILPLGLFVTCAAASIASGQAAFDAPWRSFQTGTPENGRYNVAMTAADVDGDGRVDAITAQNLFAPGLRVFRNLGTSGGSPATFEDDGTLLPLSRGAWDVVAADLDGDGDVDLAATNSDQNHVGNTVVVFRNAGNGTFATGQAFAAGEAPHGITAADLDGDGDVDLAVTNYGSIGQGTTITVLANTGSASFAAPVAYSGPAAPSRIRAGDLDGDGDADLVVSHDGTLATVRFNAGNGVFGPAVAYDYASTPYGSQGLALLDPDGDGDLDVVLAGFIDQTTSDGRLVVLRNNGSGAFATQLVPYGLRYRNLATDLVASDLDNDGRDDLVGAQQYEAGFVVFRDDDVGGFRAGEMYASVQNMSGEASTAGVAVADLDLDGDADVLSCGRITRLLSAHANVGGGIFPELPIQGRGFGHNVLDLGDVDSDGDLDVVASHGGASASDVAVYTNDGHGAYTESQRVAGSFGFAKFADLTGDGVLDLLWVSGPTAPPYDYFTARGNGNGTFAAAVRHPLGACELAHPNAVDLDGDGDLDVVNTENAGCTNITNSGRRLFVSLNNGNGTFQTATVSLVGLFPYATVAGDFDEDGVVDLATASQGVSAVVLGNGNGTFGPERTLPSGELGANILALDLDVDGHLDLVTLRDYSPNGTAGNESELVILFGDGTGAFAPVAYPHFLTQDFREWLASGDVDGDGDVDVLTGGVNDALVFENDGAGALSYAGRYGIGRGANAMHYADLTGDGRADLVALVSHDLPAFGGEYGLVVVEGLAAPSTGSLFCAGDGSAAACPCGNAGAPGHGCAHSLDVNGARLVASGTASIANDTLALVGTQMPNSSCLYFQGTTQLTGGMGTAFGDGLRCAGGTIRRLGTKANAGGASHYPGAGDASISVRGANFAGAMRTYQAWYRNAAAFCTPSTFNLTNGIALTWTL